MDQLRRSAASIPANIAEGYGLGTRPQFIRGLRIALGSAHELREHIELTKEIPELPEEPRAIVEALVDREIRLIIGLLKRLGGDVPR